MELPLFVILIIYLFLTAVCLFFAFFNIYHVIRFGVLNFTTVLVSFLFLAGIVVICFLSYQNLQLINWQESITIFRPIKLEIPGTTPPEINF